MKEKKTKVCRRAEFEPGRTCVLNILGYLARAEDQETWVRVGGGPDSGLAAVVV